MRKSRLVLVGVAVAAAAATGSAFTAGNTFNNTTNIAGYGTNTVSGATVQNIHYTVDSGDASKVDSVVFTTLETVTGMTATLQLQNAGSAVGSSVGCSPAGTTITCSLTPSVALTTFDGVALTVVQ